MTRKWSRVLTHTGFMGLSCYDAQTSVLFTAGVKKYPHWNQQLVILFHRRNRI